jgi:hypothetical protein
MSQRTTTGHVLAAARVRIALTRVCAAEAGGLRAAGTPRGRPWIARAPQSHGRPAASLPPPRMAHLQVPEALHRGWGFGGD